MMNEITFLEYLGAEEQNLLTGFMIIKGDFDLFLSLDYIYQEPLKRLIISEEEDLIPFQLYRLIHFHLYFSMSCLFRYHPSESLFSTRKAIDAALTAYKLILEPETIEKYKKRDKYFQHIKNNIQKDIANYPLAALLVKLHTLCSKYGSHADITSFNNRIEVRESSDAKIGHFLLHYFEISEPNETKKLYFQTLRMFFSMFKIFKILFNKRLKLVDPDWEFTIDNFDKKLDELLKQLK